LNDPKNSPFWSDGLTFLTARSKSVFVMNSRQPPVSERY
jgi:hypothetical protein